jgi:hypothetical protein
MIVSMAIEPVGEVGRGIGGYEVAHSMSATKMPAGTSIVLTNCLSIPDGMDIF